MKVVVIGAGGVGGLLAVLLARAGNDVGVVARGQSLANIRERGIVLRTEGAEPVVAQVRASEAAADLGPADAVIVATKAWQVNAIGPQLVPLLGDRTIVVPLQNGVDAPDTLARSLPSTAVIGGFCYMLSWIEEPGVVRLIGPKPSVTIGHRSPGQIPAIDALVQALKDAGVGATRSDDVIAGLWEKFVFIEPVGAVGGVTRSPVGVTRSLDSSRGLLVGAMREVESVARARGVRIAPGAVERALARVDALPEDGTASLQRDLEAGRPSELVDLTGSVLRHAHETRTAVPFHAFLWAALEPWELRARAARRADAT